MTGAPGAEFAVSVAAVDVAAPKLLVATSRYRLLFRPAVTPVRVSTPVVTPLYGAALARLVNVAPPLFDTCHCSVGAGVPLAAAVNAPFWPTTIVWFVGCVVIAGATFTVRVAAAEVAFGTTPLLAIARY